MNENPFQSPAPTTGDIEISRPEIVEPFVSASPRAKLFLGMLGLLSATVVVEIVFQFATLGLIQRLQAGVNVPEDEINSIDQRTVAIAGIQFLLYVASGIVFLMWLNRAYRNLPALGAGGLKHTSRSAVLWWFCPFANLVVPFRVVRETWQASDAASYLAPGGWQSAGAAPRRHRAGTPGLFPLWWAAWLVTSIGGQAVGRVSGTVTTPDGFAVLTMVTIAVDVAMLVAAGLIAMIVRRIDLLQRRGEQSALVAAMIQDGSG